MKKAQRLLDVARKTYDNGNKPEAKKAVILALTAEDAIETLDKILPRIQEPEMTEDEIQRVADSRLHSFKTLAAEIAEVDPELAQTVKQIQKILEG